MRKGKVQDKKTWREPDRLMLRVTPSPKAFGLRPECCCLSVHLSEERETTIYHCRYMKDVHVQYQVQSTNNC